MKYVTCQLVELKSVGRSDGVTCQSPLLKAPPTKSPLKSGRRAIWAANLNRRLAKRRQKKITQTHKSPGHGSLKGIESDTIR